MRWSMGVGLRNALGFFSVGLFSGFFLIATPLFFTSLGPLEALGGLLLRVFPGSLAIFAEFVVFGLPWFFLLLAYRRKKDRVENYFSRQGLTLFLAFLFGVLLAYLVFICIVNQALSNALLPL